PGGDECGELAVLHGPRPPSRIAPMAARHRRDAAPPRSGLRVILQLGFLPMAEYILSLRNVRKAHGDNVALDNVTDSFLHGASVGAVGPNGMGKSSRLKLMAGLDQPNNGDVIRAPDATVGMLQQEPPLTEGKTVLENVEEAVGEIKAKMKRLEEAYA